MSYKQLDAYEVIERRQIDDLASVGLLLEHKKTKAKVMLLENDDNNKVFCIGFRTPPKDSTGVAHIIEHTVLCGSDKYPVKDPFVELAKGSLNTFLNAMTYPDKTVYPVASCNDKDLQNLMSVYLDAVFHPNIYKEKMIFEQEGWHYECDNKEEDITINGVVYNEMKGAFSSPDDVIVREVLNGLFPDTTYGVESGGDPDCIPDLTYEAYLDFHKKYYHPSNSYIYLYGDMDMEEKLRFIDEEYLSQYDYLEIDSQIALQPAFDKSRKIEIEYPISEGENEENNTYFTYNTVIETSLDKELYVAFQILDYVICSAPGAPLKKALIDAGIGSEVYSSYDNGVYQPYFSIVAKNANQCDEEKFISIIEETLTKLVEEGIQKDSLLAALNYYEFKYKEADFGSYPKGLMYGLQSFDSWLYDAKAPFMHIEANNTFKTIRGKVETDYFEQLISKYILNNTHKAIVIAVPKKGLVAKKEEELKNKLKTFKQSLSKEELNEIIEHTKVLHQYQEEESSAEDLAKIPHLTRDDLKKEADDFINEEQVYEGTKILFHNVFTNGVSYLRGVFKIRHIDEETLPYLSILKSVLGYVDTEHYDYGTLFDQVNLKTGGFALNTAIYVNSKNLSEYDIACEFKIKAFDENIKDAFALMNEILFHSKLEDKKRLKEIIAETKSRVQASMLGAGHSLAALHAMASFSETAAVQERLAGVSFYRMLERLERDFDAEYEELVAKLKECMNLIFRKENFMFDYTGQEKGLETAKGYLKEFTEHMYTDAVKECKLCITPNGSKDGFMSASQVQYVCLAGNYLKEGLAYTGGLRVLKVMMGYEYLWLQVRVKGGAYGCMSGFSKIGDSYFVSYRDPNLTKTIDTYKKAAEFVANYKGDEKTITKYIIGAISEKDTPLTPQAKGNRSLTAYMTGYTFLEEQKERDEILSIDEEKIRSLFAYIDAFVKDDYLCVVGNENVLTEQKELFDQVEMLFAEH